MDSEKRSAYSFGGFILEGGQRRLLRKESGEPIALTAKAFDTLLYLVEHRGEVLSKDSLLRAIWPGVVVEENSLTQSISAVRQVLGESPGSNQYVATVPRQGYRFVAEVTECEPAAGKTSARAPDDSLKTSARRRSWWWMGAAAVAALAAILVIGSVIVRSGRNSAPPAIQTIAVLPFKPLLPAERDESLQLGMTETMIASLGGLAGISVTPLSSVRRYGGMEQDPLEAGRALHADVVLDGSLQHDGEQLRVTVRLLRVPDGRQLWASQFAGTLREVLGIQSDMTAGVARALATREAAGASVPYLSGGTKDATAYLLYASGRYALAQSTEPKLVLAIGYFEQAIARDSQFAPAYAGLAECYAVMGIFGMRTPTETFPRARDAALKALRLEPRLASAYGILGHIKMQYDRDWDGAEADFEHAIALDPSISEPHMYWGVLLAMRGDFDRGLEELKKAHQVEPLLTLPITRTGAVLYFARRNDEAIAMLKESIALDDRPGVAHAALGRVYMHTGHYDLALAEFAKVRGPTPGSLGDVGQALALSGRRAEALTELDRVLKLSKQHYVSAVDIAAIYVALGDSDNALAWLDRALEQRAPRLGFLAQDPAFDPLHGNPRFAAIVDSIGLWKRPL